METLTRNIELEFRVSRTEYISQVTEHLFCNALVHVIYYVVSGQYS